MTFEKAPDHINSAQWAQAVGYARQAAARVFRDGGTAVDAVRAFGISEPGMAASDWSRAVNLIADVLCHQPAKRAA